ncbi:MAG: hypothetical protein ACXWRE_04780 [Pseudobdellovibrionaceae bacterium]
MSFLLILFFMSIAAKAAFEDIEIDPNEQFKAGISLQSSYDQLNTYWELQLKKWIPYSLRFNTGPDVPLYVSQAKTEREFFTQYNLLEPNFKQQKYGAIGWLSRSFLQNANNGFNMCGIDQDLQKNNPERWDYFNKNFYFFHIISVPFKLCQDSDTSDCPLNSSYTAKNYPDLQLILVNSYRWNMMSDIDRMSLAVHEILGLLRIEEGTYGVSAEANFGVALKKNSNSFTQITFCSQHKSDR